MASIGRFLHNMTTGNPPLGIVLKSDDLAIIALNPSLPACISPGKGPPASALCLTPGILLEIRVGIWLHAELCNIKLSVDDIASMVSPKRNIATNRVSAIRRGNSRSVDEASNSKGGTPGETKPGIDLIVID